MTLLLSVGALDSSGIWWVVALASGLCSLLVLFYACSRLGYFVPIRRPARAVDAIVFNLDDARANTHEAAVLRRWKASPVSRESVTLR